MSTPTEQCTPAPLTTNPRESIRCPFSIFPTNTALVGPVVILQKAHPSIQGTRPTVLLSHKLIFPDQTEVVIGVECRALWQGSDGAAFDAPRERAWRIA